MLGIRSTFGCCRRTRVVVEHHLTEPGIDQRPGLLAGSRSVGGLVRHQGDSRIEEHHQQAGPRLGWPGQQQRVDAHPQPFAGSPPPSCGPSTLCESP